MARLAWRLGWPICPLLLALLIGGCLSAGARELVTSGAWFDCIKETATRLAEAPGSAYEIADATMGICKMQEVAFEGEATRINPATVYLIASWRQEARERALAAIIERRAISRK